MNHLRKNAQWRVKQNRPKHICASERFVLQNSYMQMLHKFSMNA